MQAIIDKYQDPPLHYKWGFWTFTESKVQKPSRYKAGTALAMSASEPIFKGTFETIYSMWAFMASIPKPSMMATANIYLFLYGTKPVWEDPKNCNGGRWMFTMKNNENIDEVWESLVLELVGFGLDPSAETTGIIMAHRPNYTKFSIWTQNKTSEANIMAIGRNIHALVAPTVVLEYQDHNAGHMEFRHVIRPK